MIGEWLQIFVQRNCVVELRALEVQLPGLDMPVTMAGYFDSDHLEQMAADGLTLSGSAKGVLSGSRRNTLSPSSQGSPKSARPSSSLSGPKRLIVGLALPEDFEAEPLGPSPERILYRGSGPWRPPFSSRVSVAVTN